MTVADEPPDATMDDLARGTTVWWYWVESRLTTTHYAVSDAEGEWVGEFDRRGAQGFRAAAEDLQRKRFALHLGRNGAEPRATVDRDVVARIADDRLHVAGRWLEIELPRDARFACSIRHGADVLLRVARWPKGPFARVEIAPEMPEASLVTLLVLFVLTCDHDLINTFH